ncbi:MAG TPA: cytochrome C [Geobacter sp.]|nr:cytochrome C [Geobacter sp.]
MKKMLFICMLLSLTVLYVQQALAQKQQHKEYAEMQIPECNSCHKGEGVAPNHDSDWVRNHRTLASKAGHNCAECHGQTMCLDCHQGGGINADLSVANFGRDYLPKSHRSDFVTIHPIKALDNPQSCYRCHDQKFCNACHARFPQGNLRIKSHLALGSVGQAYAPALNEHATEARRNLQSCQACHPDGDVCIQCHASGSTNPHPRNWRAIKNNYRDKAGSRVCTKCHLPGTY